MASLQFDYLIVGQGLAGSLLAFALMRRGLRVMVVDNDLHGSASAVAAGAINPITGHRLNLTENFARYFEIAQTFYKDLEISLGQKLWHPIDQLRLLKNRGQFAHFQKRQSQPEYDAFFGKLVTTPDLFRAPHFGALEINQSTSIDVVTILHNMRCWLADHGSIRIERVDYSALLDSGGRFSIGGATAPRIIFCEGYQAIGNPWLQNLPFKLSKGDVLTIDSRESVSKFLNWGNWLIPTPRGIKLGSTYQWQDMSEHLDVGARSKLLAGLKQHTSVQANCLEHQVGIRPTTLNRKPFVGRIQTLPGAYCFNGFGSKGCLLIPYFAERLCQNLVQQRPLPEELPACL